MKRTLGRLALAVGFLAVVPATGAFAQAAAAYNATGLVISTSDTWYRPAAKVYSPGASRSFTGTLTQGKVCVCMESGGSASLPR